jgi:hypothetical protein
MRAFVALLALSLAALSLRGDDNTLMLAGSGAAGGDASLLLRYTFSEGTGTTTSDITGNGNNGTFAGTPDWVTGHAGSGVRFDANTDYVQIADSSALDVAQVTVCTWIYIHTTPAVGSGIIHSRENGYAGGYLMLATGNGTVRFYVYDGAYKYAETNASVPAGEWVHLAGTYDGTTVRVFVNGTAQTATATASSIVYLGANRAARVGEYAGSAIQATVDDVRIYNAAKSAGDLTTIMGEH